MSNIDGDMLEGLLKRKREGLQEEQRAAEDEQKTKINKAELYLKTRPKLKNVISDNRKKFSEVFKWSPVSMPDFYIPYYDRRHWSVEVRNKIPIINQSYFLDKRTIEATAFAFKDGDTTLLHGATGTGKTTIAEQLAAYCNIPFFRVSCHGQMEASEFLGGNSVISKDGVPQTKHSDTDTTLAARYGGMLCIDEVFRTPAEALMSIQSLLEVPHRLSLQDSHGTERQFDVPASDFFLMLTDNTVGAGDSTGHFVAEIQDTSTRNRIRRCIKIDYLPELAEVKLLQKSYPDIPEEIHVSMIRVANLVREAFNGSLINETLSIRELLTWSKDLEQLKNVEQAFRLGMYSKLSLEDQAQVLDIYRQVFSKDVEEEEADLTKETDWRK